MNGRFIRQPVPIEAAAFGSTRRTAAERAVLTLTTLGMIAALIRLVSAQAARSQLSEVLVPSADIPQSPLYYAAHATQMVLLISAGLLALLSTDWRTIQRGYPFRFAMFIGAALLMTARGYSLPDLVSTKLVDITGPFPFVVSVLVFVGARRRNWAVLGKAMVILAVLLSVLVLGRLAGLHTFSRAEGVANLGGFLNTLLWPASWVALEEYPHGSFTRHLRFGPIAVYGLGSLFTQTRLNFVMVFAVMAVYAYVQRKRNVPQAGTWVVGLTVTVWLCLFAAVFLKNTQAFENTRSVISAFYSRLDDDSRTGQLQRFGEQVRPSELLLGRGSFATWYWGRGPWGGTDVGYLNLLFYGGVPLLATYIAAHLTPCLAALRKNPADSRIAAAAIVFLWAIRMFSSEYPGTSLEYYPILFCIGACISRGPLPIQSRAPDRLRCLSSGAH